MDCPPAPLRPSLLGTRRVKTEHRAVDCVVELQVSEAQCGYPNERM